MTKLETANSLARAHKEWEPNLTNVFLVEPIAETDPREPIKLLEVVDGTIERGIEPIAFPPDPAHGVDYFCYIIEVSPRELDRIRTGDLAFKIPSWSIGPELAA